MKEKIYLGDGVYLEYDYGRLRLYTWDGYAVTNEIWIHEIAEQLYKYLEHYLEKTS